MTAKEMIERYDITITIKDGKEMLTPKWQVPRNEVPELIALKPEIIEEIKKQERRAEAINNIPGLEKLENAINKYGIYLAKLDAAIESGTVAPKPPEADLDMMKEAYPIAAAYLRAREYASASHYIRAAAGKKAIDRIADGEDRKMVIAEMENEWKNYCKANEQN
jgi:hypothetical protein